jgi:hypothetical protein
MTGYDLIIVEHYSRDARRILPNRAAITLVMHATHFRLSLVLAATPINPAQVCNGIPLRHGMTMLQYDIGME